MPVGVWLGLWLNRHVNQTWFYRLMQAALFGTGLQLMYQAVRHL